MSFPSPAVSARDRMLALLQVTGGMISVQLGTSLAKLLFPVFGAGNMLGLRTFFGSVALVLFFGSWRWHGLSVRVLRLLLPYGIALTGMNAMFYLALNRLPLGIAVAIEFIGPLTLAFLSSRRVTDVLWIAVTVVGLALLLKPQSAVTLDLLGVGYALVGAGFWTSYIVICRKLAHKVPPGHACAVGMGIGGVILLVPCTLPALAIGLHQPTMLALSIVVALSSSALPYALEMRAMHRLTTREFGLLCSLEPVCATLSGTLLLHEIPSLRQLCGILCIVTASAGIVLGPSQNRKEALPSELPELLD
ncbi:EamA family transporter [Acetobacter sp. TBRC 12305]|uniref:EamA family transporter n=1 Tax=Acetobacter garciniae TaxID=2817435 RepID=A0A939HM09_9PROT|nr:EamA family transporter [Acetobacter garciniae]MBO1323752.1 EamA family transporter [Acetobacter garciniae]MBX0343441.1 EamA family transporter [Acetobacter garciniae]